MPLLFTGDLEVWRQTVLHEGVTSFGEAGFNMFGNDFIFHWNRLIYELYVIIGLLIFFVINYFINSLITKLKSGGSGK